jgi:hypothetical protein
LGNSPYPTTLDEAHEILSVQAFDKAYKEKMAKKKSQSNEGKKSKEDKEDVVTKYFSFNSEDIIKSRTQLNN